MPVPLYPWRLKIKLQVYVDRRTLFVDIFDNVLTIKNHEKHASYLNVFTVCRYSQEYNHSNMQYYSSHVVHYSLS